MANFQCSSGKKYYGLLLVVRKIFFGGTKGGLPGTAMPGSAIGQNTFLVSVFIEIYF